MRHNHFLHKNRRIYVPNLPKQGDKCTIKGSFYEIKSTRHFPCDSHVIYLEKDIVIFIPGDHLREMKDGYKPCILTTEEYEKASKVAHEKHQKDKKAQSPFESFKRKYPFFPEDAHMEIIDTTPAPVPKPVPV